MMIEALLAELRYDGWMVAAHNDYRLRGKLYTFWLFTNNDECRFIKGEGHTDIEALQQCIAMRDSP